MAGEVILPRRTFLKSMVAAFATPAIVRVTSLDLIKGVLMEPDGQWVVVPPSLYQQLTDVTRRVFVSRLFVQIHFNRPPFAAIDNDAYLRVLE